MNIAIFETENLNLPRDVKRPDQLVIQGKYTGDHNEIVVIKQLKREIFQDACVCHITNGDSGVGIYDCPGFRYLDATAWTQIICEGIKFTMVCVAEISNMRPATNWLW